MTESTKNADSTKTSESSAGLQKTQDLQEALRQAARMLATQLSDATSLTVKTQYVQLSEDPAATQSPPRLIGETVIELDGDTTMTIPLQLEAGALVVNQALLEVHLGNVKNALEYRQKLVDAMLDLAKQVRLR